MPEILFCFKCICVVCSTQIIISFSLSPSFNTHFKTGLLLLLAEGIRRCRGNIWSKNHDFCKKSIAHTLPTAPCPLFSPLLHNHLNPLTQFPHFPTLTNTPMSSYIILPILTFFMKPCFLQVRQECSVWSGALGNQMWVKRCVIEITFYRNLNLKADICVRRLHIWVPLKVYWYLKWYIGVKMLPQTLTKVERWNTIDNIYILKMAKAI